VPVTKRLWKLLGALFIDRVLLGAVAIGAATLLGVHLHRWPRFVGPFLVLLAFAIVNEILNRIRLEEPSAKLRLTPNSIRRLVNAKFIVFGHSHAPETIPLDDGGTYFNTGTWASDDTRHAFTHLLVTPARDGEAAHAVLRQWKDGLPIVYVAG
jgi:hypothetical protein